MDNWLKGLVAAACVVVIAGGVHFAWGEWSAYRQATVQADYDDCVRYLDYQRRYKLGSDGQGIPDAESTVNSIVKHCRERFTLPAS